MDPYTETTREWLDERFQRTASDGVYVAHEPIYGLRGGHHDGWVLERYVRTLEIMRTLARLPFDSCLDIGSAEGYHAALVRHFFGGRVVACDLSQEAAKRAREIYGLEAHAADVHDLQFADREFDVVLCSETLEHVNDFRRALSEILRVARLGAVLTVPHEPVATIEANRASGRPHEHIHQFEHDSLDFLTRESGFSVIARGLASPVTGRAGSLVEGAPRSPREPRARHRLANFGIQLYNRLAPISSRILGERTEVALVELDRWICERTSGHRNLMFVVLKQSDAWLEKPRRRVTAKEVISFAVPPHRLVTGR